MSAKTTYQATCPTTGETVNRSTAREYAAALAVTIPARTIAEIPAGTYWVTTGHKMHEYNREAGTRGYWDTISEAIPEQHTAETVAIYSFHKDAAAAEKAGRALVNQWAKVANDTARNYGVTVEQAPITYTVVETTVAGAEADAKAAEKARLAAEVARLEAELAAAKAALAAA